MFHRLLSVLLVVALLVSMAPVTLAEETEEFVQSTAEPETEEGLEEAPSRAITDYITLQLGDKDEDGSTAYIVTMQMRLIELNYLADNADGVYGNNTQEAVKAFQQNNGLTVTGIADPGTQEKLFSDAMTLVAGDAAVAAGNEEAKQVQAKLQLWGFLEGKADGVLGSDSQKAIVRFKNYATARYPSVLATPIPTSSPVPAVTNTPDPDVLPLVNDVARPEEGAGYEATADIDKVLMTFIDGTIPFEVYVKSVQSGDEGDEVWRVQRRLHTLKYLYESDGRFGENTVRSLMYFQTKNGLSVTGVADKETQELLFSDKAIKSEEYIFPYKLYVKIDEQRVYVVGWNGTSYSEQVKKIKCSTGKNATPTPKGTFQASGPSSQGEWYWFKEFNCYAKWGYRIVGGILFHSVTFTKGKRLVQSSVRNLGRKASHGCVRLPIDEAEWIYKNCPAGTTVVIE